MAYGDQFKSDNPLWFDIVFNPPFLLVLGTILIGALAINDALDRKAKVEACEAEHKATCQIEREVALPKKPSG